MELEGLYTMQSDSNSSNQDTICKTTFYRYYRKFGFKGSIVDLFLVLLPQYAFRAFADLVCSIFLFDHAVAFFASFQIFELLNDSRNNGPWD